MMVNEADIKDCYLAFLDILGFKNFIFANDPKEVLENYNYFFVKFVCKKLEEFTLNYAFLSDSVILWSSADDKLKLLDLVEAVCSIISVCLSIGKFYWKRFPIRGALVKDWFYLHDQIVLGKALVKAYILEESQKWIGCILKEEDFTPEEIKVLKSRNLVLEYKAPIVRHIELESGEKNHLCLNWPSYWTETFHRQKEDLCYVIRNLLNDDFFKLIMMNIDKIESKHENFRKMYENFKEIINNTCKFIEDTL